jgi:putative FmdB family regulatory protein
MEPALRLAHTEGCMPLFEYRCPACDSQFELLIRGAAVPTCPACGSTELERLLSLFAVSSEGTQMRSRETLGASQRLKSAAVQKERSHFKHDHHDD